MAEQRKGKESGDGSSVGLRWGQRKGRMLGGREEEDVAEGFSPFVAALVVVRGPCGCLLVQNTGTWYF